MLSSLWLPVVIVTVGVVWLVAVVSGLGKPRRPRRPPRSDDGESVIPFMWGGDDDGHSLH